MKNHLIKRKDKALPKSLYLTVSDLIDIRKELILENISISH